MMKAASSTGCAAMGAWLDLRMWVVAFIFRAMARSKSGLIMRSSLHTRYHEGRICRVPGASCPLIHPRFSMSLLPVSVPAPQLEQPLQAFAGFSAADLRLAEGC